MSFTQNFTFILNNLQPDFIEEVELIPGHVFRKAHPNEIEKIKPSLQELGGRTFTFIGTPIYESIWIKKESKISSGYHEILPPEKWRYYVIAFEGPNSKIHPLECASNLIRNELDYGITFLKINPNSEEMGVLWPGSLQITYQFHNDLIRCTKEPVVITQKEIKVIGEYFHLIEQLPNKFAFIKKAASKFNTLKNIPRDSELLILGYFALIESLITHMPRANETLDSINHQIVNKMILLKKRFERELNYSDFFKDANEEKIWKLLYSYRSCLAHGNEPNFKKDLQILNDKKTIFSFIQEALKLVIIVSLREPELISDLRSC